MRPLTLRFKQEEVEGNYIKEHKAKHEPRFRPLLFSIAVVVLLMAIPDIFEHRVNQLIIKFVAAGVSLIVAAFARPIYENDMMLVIASSSLAYILLFTRILVEGEDGSTFLQATEKDVGFVFLIFVILGTIVGLRFIVCVSISGLVAGLTILSIWTSPSSDSNQLRVSHDPLVT